MPSVVLLFISGMCLTADAAAPARGSSTNPAVADALNLSALLADPAGVVTGHDRFERMRAQLTVARTPLEQAGVELAMANWLLAVPTASPATRWFVGLSEEQDLDRIHESARDAQVHLARARKLLGSDDADSRERRRELRSAASVLDAFATVFFACGGQTQGQAYRDGCEHAAIGLATARESEKPSIAAAAMLWQAQAFALADRTERALSILPEALAKPDRLPYDFMSRLLRCRILAAENEPAAAIALAIRMRVMVKEWFPQLDNAAVRTRTRLIGVLQAKITRDWLAQLNDSPQAAGPIAGTLEPLREMLFSDGQRQPVYHLDTALPVIIEAPPLPALESPSAETHRDEGREIATRADTQRDEDSEIATQPSSTRAGEQEEESE